MFRSSLPNHFSRNSENAREKPRNKIFLRTHHTRHLNRSVRLYFPAAFPWEKLL